jgi:hypothetical protein
LRRLRGLLHSGRRKLHRQRKRDNAAGTGGDVAVAADTEGPQIVFAQIEHAHDARR